MRYLLILILSLSCIAAQSQQINPVPDYIFRNQMSVGRNTFTDTAAYMSIGPRYGAVKGFMPPIVTDTNAVTGVKRNGLLIFSIQLNNFAYWDSTTARFRKITAEASVDSLLFATRAYRQKGDDSLGAIIAVKTDTGLLSTKAYRQKGIDSVVTLISTLGGGTVLSVSAGTGMNFSTITTSGAVNADTLILSTRAWRQKAVDSLGGIATTKMSISDTATMLGAYLRKADTTAMLTPYLRKVDTTAMLGNYVRAAGFGLVKGTQTLSSDTAAMATRSRVQKGLDSVAALVAAPDSLVFSTRAWRQKGDDSLGVIIGTKATATGTTNYLSKFTGTSALGNSIVYATTSEVGISTPSPTHTLDVNGRTRIRTIDSTATGMNMLYSDVDGVIKKAAIPAGGSGTVTSVGTGFGLSGGTITTTGTLLVDSASIATRLRVQKGIDSVSSLIAAKLNISDTATMLSPYAKTSALGLYLPLSGGTLTGGLTGTTGAFTSSGSDNTFNITHSSGSGIALNISKGGNGEGLYVNKTSGTGNAATIIGTLNATTLVKSGGTSTQYLMADGTTSTLTNPVTGTGTTNRSVKFTGTSAVGNGSIADSSTSVQMTILSGGNVGVNTVAPAYKLDVAGSLRNTTGAAFATSSGNVLIGTTTDGGAYKLDVQGALRNTTGAAFATASGNVGVGTTSPISAAGYTGFTVRNNTSGGIIQNTDGTVDMRLQLTPATAGLSGTWSSHPYVINTNALEALRVTTTRNLLVGGTTDNSIRADITGTLRSTQGAYFATSSGGVGIGTTTPLAAAGYGILTLQGASGGIVQATDGTVDYRMQLAGSVASHGTYNNYPFNILTNGTEAIRVTTSQNVGLNTTAPSERLDVNGRARVRTIDSTATAMNMLYADATGVIKKAAVPSGGSGTVTSVATGFGLSGGTITTTGTLLVDSASVATRARVQKGIDSVALISVKGSGTTNTVPIFTDATTLGNSLITQASSEVYVNKTTDDGDFKLQVQGGFFQKQGDAVLNESGGNTGIGVAAPSEKLHVNGKVRIATVDSTATGINMLYVDNTGVVKKAAVPTGLTMSDDVMTVAGSWVVTKDAGSGFSINNVAYTTNGTTKMVTIDGAFYITAELFSDASWDDVATIPAGFRPQKTVNWTNNFIVSGAEYETSGGTDFTGALSWTYAQMRVTDEGKVQINASIDTNTIDAGGAEYVVIQFTQTYIIK